MTFSSDITLFSSIWEFKCSEVVLTEFLGRIVLNQPRKYIFNMGVFPNR